MRQPGQDPIRPRQPLKGEALFKPNRGGLRPKNPYMGTLYKQ